jgi:RNA polymerase sigma-70 factor, ECF subfamily
MTQQPNDGRWLPESQYSYLSLLAYCQMPRQLRSQLDPDDAVQETVRRALENLDQFKGKTEAEFRSWLRIILKNVLLEAIGKLPKGRPNVSLQELEDSSNRFERYLAGEDSTPGERVMREEQLVRLANALAALPANEQQAVRLHHLDGHSSAEVGRRMGRSVTAVSGLLFRGLKRLRESLVEPECT